MKLIIIVADVEQQLQKEKHVYLMFVGSASVDIDEQQIPHQKCL